MLVIIAQRDFVVLFYYLTQVATYAGHVILSEGRAKNLRFATLFWLITWGFLVAPLLGMT